MNILGGRRDAIAQQYYYRAGDEKDASAIAGLFATSMKNSFANNDARKNWKSLPAGECKLILSQAWSFKLAA